MSAGAARLLGGLAGGVALAHGRASGLALIDRTPEGAWASFAAMWVCLPPYLLLRLLTGGPAGKVSLRLFAAEAIGYVLGWFALPMLMLGVAEGMGRRGRFPGFVAAWNWAKPPQLAAMLAAALVAATGLVPGAAADGFALAALLYALWVSWFAARASLGIGGAQAAFVVGADVLIGLFITGVTLALGRG